MILISLLIVSLKGKHQRYSRHACPPKKNMFSQLRRVFDDLILCCFSFHVEKDKPAVPTMQLNVIRLLEELNVAVNKSEVVDMILPLFIESVKEGDASTLLVYCDSEYGTCFLNLVFFVISLTSIRYHMIYVMLLGL